MENQDVSPATPRGIEFATLRRMNSGPFARKPIPNPIQGDNPTIRSGDATGREFDGGAMKDTSPLSSSPQSSYRAINDDGSVIMNVEESDPNVHSSSLERHLSLFDLIAIGVGGTIGSGLFVLCGMVAHDYAGPATSLSWAISGFAAVLSGCCYAELSGRIPLPGSSYAYTYVAMGELPAVIVAACLSLEFIAAAAAISRSWADKIVVWLSDDLLSEDNWLQEYLTTDAAWSPLALLISSSSVFLLLNGVKESKLVTNTITALKLGLVVFMVVVGFAFVRPSNWKPFIPPEFGLQGVFRGAMGTFFGYIGYDEVCSLGGEAQNPRQNLPRAILWTLAIVSVLYILSSLSLTGMQQYGEISSVSGFPGAFRANDANFAAEITALGEIITLPIVVLICTMSQPRLQYALAKDGLLPKFFLEQDQHGNLFKGTAAAGALVILIATFVPFTHLNDMISCAVLCALSFTDSSLIILWHESPEQKNSLAAKLLVVFHLASLAVGISITHFCAYYYGKFILILSVCALIFCVAGLYLWCPKNHVFGGGHRWPKNVCISHDKTYFRTPLVPFLPCLAIFFNWYLISQLELIGIAALLAFLGLATAYYFFYAVHHSIHNDEIERDHEKQDNENPRPNEMGMPLRELPQIY